MSALTEKLFRGSATWPNLAVGIIFALIGLTDLLSSNPEDDLDATIYLLFAAALLAMYAGARLESRAVQWIGLAAMIGGILLFVADLFGLMYGAVEPAAAGRR